MQEEVTAKFWAEEFGSTERGEGGWSQAQLAACCVGTGPGQVPVAQFAAWAQVSVPTVNNYVQAWDLAVAQGVEIPPRILLSPDKVGTFPLPTRPFNGVGGFVKTRKGGANSTPAIIDKIKTKSGSYASAVANDHEAMAALLETASPESITAALATVDSRTLRSVARKATEERQREFEAEIIAGGGRIPTPEELGSQDQGGEVGALLARQAAWGEVNKAGNALRKALETYGLVGSETFEAEWLRTFAMELMDSISMGATEGVQL